MLLSILPCIALMSAECVLHCSSLIAFMHFNSSKLARLWKTNLFLLRLLESLTCHGLDGECIYENWFCEKLGSIASGVPQAGDPSWRFSELLLIIWENFCGMVTSMVWCFLWYGITADCRECEGRGNRKRRETAREKPGRKHRKHREHRKSPRVSRRRRHQLTILAHG